MYYPYFGEFITLDIHNLTKLCIYAIIKIRKLFSIQALSLDKGGKT